MFMVFIDVLCGELLKIKFWVKFVPDVMYRNFLGVAKYRIVYEAGVLIGLDLLGVFVKVASIWWSWLFSELPPSNEF